MTLADFERIAGFAGVPATLKGGVVAIGNFDGIHRGHQAVLDEAISQARSRDVPALVLTFEPHPRTIFRPDLDLFRLTTAPMRARLLRAMGFDGVVEQGFSRNFAEMSAEDFVQQIIMRGLGAVHVVAGHDFHNNAEDRELLKRFKLFGPPGTIFFDPKGEELAGARVIGFQDADRFLQSLQAAGL